MVAAALSDNNSTSSEPTPAKKAANLPPLSNEKDQSPNDYFEDTGIKKDDVLSYFEPILGDLFSATQSKKIPYSRPRRRSLEAWGHQRPAAVKSSASEAPAGKSKNSDSQTPFRPTSAPYERVPDVGTSSRRYSNQQVYEWLREGHTLRKLFEQVRDTVKELEYYKLLVSKLPQLFRSVGEKRSADDTDFAQSVLQTLQETASELFNFGDTESKSETKFYGFDDKNKIVSCLDSKQGFENLLSLLSLEEELGENVGYDIPPVEGPTSHNMSVGSSTTTSATSIMASSTTVPTVETSVSTSATVAITQSSSNSLPTTTSSPAVTEDSESPGVKVLNDPVVVNVDKEGNKKKKDLTCEGATEFNVFATTAKSDPFCDPTQWKFPADMHPVSCLTLCQSMRRNSPYVVQDVFAEEQKTAAYSLAASSPNQTFLERSIGAFPLRWSDSGATNMALACKGNTPGFFKEVHKDTIQTLCSVAAMVLKSSQMIVGGRNAKRQADLLLKMVQSVIKGDNVRDIIERIIRVAYDLLNSDRVSVFLVDWEAEELVLSVSQDAAGLRIPLDKGIAGTVASTGQVLNIPDAYEDPRFDRTFDNKIGYRTKSILAMPVRSHDGQSVVAVVQAINKLSPDNQHGFDVFTDADVRMMAAVTDTAGVTLHKARLLQEANVARKQNEALVNVVKIVRNPSAEDNLEIILDRLTEVAYSLVDADLIVLFVLDELRRELRGKKYDTSKLRNRVSKANNQYSLGQGTEEESSPTDEVPPEDAGLENATYEEIVVPLGKGIPGNVASTEDPETIITRKARQHPFYDEAYDRLGDLADTGLLCMPLLRPDGGSSHSRPVAVLQAVHKRDGSPFSSTDLKLLEAFGAEVSHVIAENSYSIAYERVLHGDQGSQADDNAKVQSFLTQFTRKNQGFTAADEDDLESDNSPRRQHSAALSDKTDPSTAPELPRDNLELPQWLLCHQPRKEMAELMTRWDFDVLQYTPQDLQLCCVDMLHYAGLIDRFQLPVTKLIRFINRIANRYRDNHYHNWHHGASVVHVSFVIMQASTAVKNALPMLHRLALLLSAICHDVDHPGLNNGYHVSVESLMHTVHCICLQLGLDDSCCRLIRFTPWH